MANQQTRSRTAYDQISLLLAKTVWILWADLAMFNTHFLFASLICGSIGVGYFIYGKRQSSWVPMVGGVLMIAASYFSGSALIMSLICIGLMAAIYVLLKRGF